MPLRPISTNQPKNATMKSFIATVRPAPARPSTVVVWLGMPKTNEQDHDRAHRLRRELHHCPQGVDPLVLRGHAGE